MSLRSELREGKAAAFALAGYAAALTCLSWTIVNEDWDGIKMINNAVSVWGFDGLGVPLDARRPPAGWLALSPVFASAYAWGGPQAALKAARVLMPSCAAAVIWAWHRFYRARFPAPLAAALAVLLALNPMVVQFSPFAAVDVLSMLGVLFFVTAGEDYLELPGARAYAVLAAACLTAFLLKYHLGVLFAAALAAALAGAKTRLAPRAWAPLTLLPVVCWSGGVLVLGALLWAVESRPVWEAPLAAHGELWANFAFNVLERKHSSWTLYAEALFRQLGPGLVLLAAWGLSSWLLRGGRRERFWAATLLLPLLVMTAFVPNREARYVIALLPLIYAAIGEGVLRARDALGGSRLLGAQVLLAGLLLMPWGETLRAARYLLLEPSVHADAPWALGRLLDARLNADQCVGWVEGDMQFRAADRVYRYEPYLVVGAPTFRFFLRSPVRELLGGADAPACAGAMIVPKWTPAGAARWDGPAQARVYAGAATKGKALWEVRETGVSAGGGR